jgi:hypothetical protein
VTFRSIIRVIASTSLSSSAACVPTPALLTSSVMLASSFSFASTAASDARSLRSGGDDLDAALRVVRDALGERGQPVAIACDQDQVVAAAREAVCVDCADAGRCARDDGRTAMCFSHDVAPCWEKVDAWLHSGVESPRHK